MKRFSWKMSPEESVHALSAWSARIRKSMAPTAGGRRHVHDIIRRRRRWYIKVGRITDLPAAVFGADVGQAWETASPRNMQIVIPLDRSVVASSDIGPGHPVARRKHMRRIVRQAEAIRAEG